MTTALDVKKANILESIADDMLLHPIDDYSKRAIRLGCSAGFLRNACASDAFEALLRSKRAAVTDNGLHLSIDEQLRGLTSLSIEVIQNKLAADPNNAELAMRVLEMQAKAKAAAPTGGNLQANFIVQLPEKSSSTQDWQAKYGLQGN